jgi:hypothetical protein
LAKPGVSTIVKTGCLRSFPELKGSETNFETPKKTATLSEQEIIAVYQSIEGEAHTVVDKSCILIFPQLLRRRSLEKKFRHDFRNKKPCSSGAHAIKLQFGVFRHAVVFADKACY